MHDSLLYDIVKKRILLLDGAMGTMIQQYNLTEQDFRGSHYADIPGIMKGNNDILNLTRPDIVADIHRKYLEAGADIIETNTFSAQRISQSDYNLSESAKEINTEGARIARRIADEFTKNNPERPRFVAGSIGPTNRSCSISPDINNPASRNITFDQIADAYVEQMTALLEENVDILLIETIFDTLNAKAALAAAQIAMEKTGKDVPLMISVTVSDIAGRTLSGQTLEAFLASIEHANVFSVGLNCSFGAQMLKPFVKELASQAPYYISVYPNAGLPNALGKYDQTPDQMTGQMKDIIDASLVNIIGGCCGTTEEYISAFRQLIDKTPADRIHKPVPQHDDLWLSGLELLEVTQQVKFVNIGERCNVAGSRKFLRLIKEHNYNEALSIARKQVEDGALILDINMDDGLLDSRQEMTTFLNLVMSDPDISRVPIMIDSSDWNVLETGLKCVQGKCIVNSISLKEGEVSFKKRARIIKLLGAAVVVMAFDEQGQATTYERKKEICNRAYHILVDELGFNPRNIIFDPNILSVATGIEEHNNYALDFIKAVSWIHENLPGANVSGGVSNLSFALRGNNYVREAMHAAFLYHSINAGQNFGIVNPATKVTYDSIPAELLHAIEDVLFNRRKDATERLIEQAETIKASNSASTDSVDNTGVELLAWRQKTLDERLKYALQKGVDDYLSEDINEAVSVYQSPTKVIEEPLMNAMNYVGQLFGDGKMFLPQVVKSARTMSKAVALLQPFMRESSTESTIGGKTDTRTVHKPKVLLATVKGDVHDIGKNIVSVVMSCNGFDVIDLGTMVPADIIVNKAISENVDIIGLSGLITPSLEEMVNVAKALQEQKADIPIMIGGATTSELHTALKIAPVYNAPVVWVKDASMNSSIATSLLDKALKKTVLESLNDKYKVLRQNYEQKNDEPLSLEDARHRKPKLY